MLDHTCGEINHLACIQVFKFMMMLAAATWSIRSLRMHDGSPAAIHPNLACFQVENIACPCIATLAALTAILQHTRMTGRAQWRLGNLDDVVFRTRFSFQQHVMLLME